MSLESLLKETESLTDSCRALLEEEMALLRSEANAPDEAFYEKKRALIHQLTENVEKLRKQRETLEEQPYHLKGQLDHLQQKFMQVLRSDRELERLLLAPGNRDSGQEEPSAQNDRIRQTYLGF
jgi:chaperonin cofactor prefoldin